MKRTRSIWLSVVLGVAGVVMLVVAAANSDYTACTPGEPVNAGTIGDGSFYVSCGGTDPTPFLIVGLVALGLALVAATLSMRRARITPT